MHACTYVYARICMYAYMSYVCMYAYMSGCMALTIRRREGVLQDLLVMHARRLHKETAYTQRSQR
jgi:hypothetical protein